MKRSGLLFTGMHFKVILIFFIVFLGLIEKVSTIAICEKKLLWIGFCGLLVCTIVPICLFLHYNCSKSA
jgi:hypothetical protein